jgi:hypothetical protein
MVGTNKANIITIATIVPKRFNGSISFWLVMQSRLMSGAA